MVFIILLGITSIGLITVVFLLFNEQRSRKRLFIKLKRQRSTNKEQETELSRLMKIIEEYKEKHQNLQEMVERREDQLKTAQKTVRQSIKDFLDQTKLKDIMSTKVVSIDQDSPFGLVPKKMRENHVRHLPVIDKDKQLVGLITQRLLYQIQSPRKLIDGEWYYDQEMLDGVILKHVMVKDVYVLSPEDRLGKALIKMVHSEFGSIPVVDEQRCLKGIVTRKDLLRIAADLYQK